VQNPYDQVPHVSIANNSWLLYLTVHPVTHKAN